MSLFSSWSSTSAGLVGNSRVRFGQGSPSRVAVDRPLDTLKPLIPPPTPPPPHAALKFSFRPISSARMSSFKKNPKSSNQRIDSIASCPIGFHPSHYDGIPIASTGIASLDDLIGGGLPIRSSFLILEDDDGAYAKLMLRWCSRFDHPTIDGSRRIPRYRSNIPSRCLFIIIIIHYSSSL